MIDKELIESWRKVLKPTVSSWLYNINYEHMGEQDKEEFERDFDEILDLALVGLKYKAQLSREDATSDTISRQAAIDALAEQMPTSYTPDGSHPADEGIFAAQEIYADCIETIKALPSAQPEQKWIPVSERLPSEKGEYLVTNRQGYVVRYCFNCNASSEEYWERCALAWIPLPEPYKESEGE